MAARESMSMSTGDAKSDAKSALKAAKKRLDDLSAVEWKALSTEYKRMHRGMAWSRSFFGVSELW